MLVFGKLWSASSRNLHAWHQVEVDLGLHLVPHMSQPGDASTESPEALAETWGCRRTTWARHTWQLMACKRKESKIQLERHFQNGKKLSLKVYTVQVELAYQNNQSLKSIHWKSSLFWIQFLAWLQLCPSICFTSSGGKRNPCVCVGVHEN